MCNTSLRPYQQAIMADWKGRSLIFKTPVTVSLKDIKDAITAEIGPEKITSTLMQENIWLN